jgi:Rieske Fe-S protein
MTSRPNPALRLAALSRRTVLGASVVGAAGLLTACGGGSSTADPASSASKPASGGGALVKTSGVPVGNGVILEAKKVVVVQPTAGQFKAFTAVCTHMGCTVATIKGGTISCPCHGSTYSAKDGSVTGGPAPRPLKEIKVTVKGAEVVEG